jgi:hypothetical protein
VVTRRRLTLATFIRKRLGCADNDFVLLQRMVSRSFGAGSFSRFWRYWNPVYSYYLGRFCYRPLRKMLPRPLAVVATFACSGFLLHDLPFWWGVTALKTRSIPVPFVALWFAVMAVLLLVGDRLRLDYSLPPTIVRVALNLLQIVAAAAVALAIFRLAR